MSQTQTNFGNQIENQKKIDLDRNRVNNTFKPSLDIKKNLATGF